jgi:hypothetical protein
MTKRQIEMGGPLAGYADGFTQRLAGLGYGRQRTQCHLGLLFDLSGWLELEGLTPAGFAEPQLARFLGSRRARDEVDLVTERGCSLLLEHLRDLGAVPHAHGPVVSGPVGGLLGGYRDYLANEHGGTTRSSRCWRAWVCVPRRWPGCD